MVAPDLYEAEGERGVRKIASRRGGTDPHPDPQGLQRQGLRKRRLEFPANTRHRHEFLEGHRGTFGREDETWPGVDAYRNRNTAEIVVQGILEDHASHELRFAVHAARDSGAEGHVEVAAQKMPAQHREIIYEAEPVAGIVGIAHHSGVELQEIGALERGSEIVLIADLKAGGEPQAESAWLGRCRGSKGEHSQDCDDEFLFHKTNCRYR